MTNCCIYGRGSILVVCLNAPAELVELEWINRHMLGAGVAGVPCSPAEQCSYAEPSDLRC